MSELPATLPNIKTARLPAIYEAAKKQLAECARVDECKEWSDKAAALASYAKQVNDESLLTMARRIKLRAHDRMGELLKAIETAGRRTDKPVEGARQRSANWSLSDVQPTRTQAAREAGLSEHQQKTAMRINAVPREEFEAAVESETPPTVTELAERGTTPFITGCLNPGCDGRASSFCYRAPQEILAEVRPALEWYRPTGEELAALKPASLDHVARGGLLSRVPSA